MIPKPNPILMVSLYQMMPNRAALHIQEGEDIMIIEVDSEELAILKNALDKLIAVLEKRLVWAKLPSEGGPQ